MSRLLRLYPAAWRERYEAEFIGTLQERPVGLTGSVDVVRGAVDAHLHPELFGGARQPWTHRLPGVLAMTAGLIWSWFWLRVLLVAPNEEWGDSVGLAMMLMLISVPGYYMAAYWRRIGVTLAAIGAGVVLGRVLPWSVGDGVLNVAVGGTAGLLVAAGMLTLVAVRAGIGRAVRGFLLAIVLLVPATIAIPVLGGFGPGDPGGAPAMVVAILPYGIAWAIIGLRMTIRGSETIHDARTIKPPSEVAAA
jgi:hypothetical protein